MKFKKEKLGNLIRQIRGVTYKKEESSDDAQKGFIPLLTANNIGDKQNIIFNNFNYIEKSQIRDNQLLKKGDIIISTSSGSIKSIGRTAYVDSNYEISVGAFCKILRSKENINSKYLSYFLSTDFVKHEITKRISGANIKNLKNDDINNLLVPFFSLETQNKIVAILERTHNLIQKRQQTIEILDQLVKAVFLEMFENLLKDKKQQKSLDKHIKNGPQNGIYKHNDYYGKGTKIVRIDSFYDGVIKTDEFKSIELNVDEVKKYLLQQNDILINRVNSKKFLGKSAIVKSLIEDTVFESNIMRFSVDEDILDPYFLIYALQLNYIKKQILQKSKDAINQSSINQTDVKSLMLPLPSIELQKYFSNIYQVILSIKEKLNANLIELNILFQSLLQKAFKGELEFEKVKILEDILPNLKIEELLTDVKLLKALLEKLQKQEFKTGSNYKMAQNLLFQLLDNKKSGVFQQCDVETENLEIKHEAS